MSYSLGRGKNPIQTNSSPKKDEAGDYKQRSCLIEPVFGDRKHNRQFRSFRRRGLNAVRSEWAFIHLAANMLKLYQHRSAAAIA
jgi:Transposase DDE domain